MTKIVLFCYHLGLDMNYFNPLGLTGFTQRVGFVPTDSTKEDSWLPLLVKESGGPNDPRAGLPETVIHPDLHTVLGTQAAFVEDLNTQVQNLRTSLQSEQARIQRVGEKGAGQQLVVMNEKLNPQKRQLNLLERIQKSLINQLPA